MKHFATICVTEYEGRARNIMENAGYRRTELFYDKKGKVFKIAHFSDGTIIDGRKGNFLNKFYKKCYNE
jgi:hypothetical protein